ncbi:lantibiotic dehydratase [Paenibacillus sp. JX-17]|uniref:Lantibiotic dehydratase n=1 Tax=Paenibacillus lacisoli TaxID=3064525 RepID=A0ABT9CF78_9BACL|nr:lantibiotic dehydratase [Paenibacillus sp. JX-17]MDO7907924.1 lantibiotic dehydratase [Paenibacillus sp. JX-17]
MTVKLNQVSELVLGRVSVNSANQLNAYIFDQSRMYLAELKDLEAKLEDLREAAVNALYQVIPQMDKKISGKLLSLKRKIHNHKKVDFAAVKPMLKAIDMDVKEKSQLEDWIEAEQSYQGMKDDFLNLYREEEMKNEKALYDFFQTDNEFVRGLPIVNSRFSEYLNTRQREHFRIGSNLVKTAYSYLIRGTVKTSPLSTFTQLTLTNFQGGAIHEGDQERSTLKWSKALVTHLFESLANDREYAELFVFRATDSIVSQDGVKTYFRGTYSTEDNIFSKSEDILKHSQYLAILNTLENRAVTYSELLRCIDHSYPEVIADFLIKQRLIRPVLPFPHSAVTPFSLLSEHIKSHIGFREAAHSEICILLEHIELLKGRLCKETLKTERDTLLAEMKTCLRSIYESVHIPFPDWLEHNPVVYEDVRCNVGIPPLGSAVQEDLLKLEGYLKPYVYQHSLYSRLTDLFKQKYGEGNPVNILAFLSEVMESEAQYSQLLKNSRQEDIMNVTNKRNGGYNKDNISITTYYQIVSESHEEIMKGNYLLVLNKITDGSGAIFARFNQLFSEDSYKNKLKEWSSSVNETSLGYEFTVGGDWTTLQESFRILDHQLKWIGELPDQDPDHILCVSDLRGTLRDGRLILLNPEGERIKPVYLGSVPEHLAVDLSKLFITIIKPWFLRIPFGSHPLNNMNTLEGITRIPRVQEGRIVFEREKWIVPIEELQAIELEYQKSERFIELNKWRHSNDIPEEVYITLQSDQFMESSKPFWFHFRSIMSVDQLFKSLSNKYKQIIFTEALPSLQQQWFSPDRETYATEFMSLTYLSQ